MGHELGMKVTRLACSDNGNVRERGRRRERGRGRGRGSRGVGARERGSEREGCWRGLWRVVHDRVDAGELLEELQRDTDGKGSANGGLEEGRHAAARSSGPFSTILSCPVCFPLPLPLGRRRQTPLEFIELGVESGARLVGAPESAQGATRCLRLPAREEPARRLWEAEEA